MSEPDDTLYTLHSRWSDPDRFGAYLAALSSDPGVLPEIIGGLMLHPLFAPATVTRNPELRRVADIIEAILAKDGRSLDQSRELTNRVLGTCRSQALLACATLRHHNVPARLRVGFADYFTPGFAEDHWVCEYRDGEIWSRLDAELTASVRQRYSVRFLSTDVPRDRFLTAGSAWIKVRYGKRDPAHFGVSTLGLNGLWFVASSMLRDLAALNSDEMMPWDYWGPARDFRPGADISADWLRRFDALADALAVLDDMEADAHSILAVHAWAAREASVLSFPEGEPTEFSIA